MPATLMNSAKVSMLDTLIPDTASDWKVMLFTNNVSIVPTLSASDLIEATYAGYARQTPSFPAALLNTAQLAESNALELSFVVSGSSSVNFIYGYALIENDGSSGATDKLLFAERFDNPVPMSANGDELRVKLRLTLTQGT